MKSTVKKLLLLGCVLALCLTGCGGKASTVRYVPFDEWDGKAAVLEMAPDMSPLKGVLEFDFQEDVQGIAFYCDVWQDGQCIATTPQLRAGGTEQTKSLCISIGMEDTSCRWDLVEKGPEALDGGEVTNALLPLMETELPVAGKGSYGSKAAFIGKTIKNHTVRLKAGESYVLAAQIFDLNIDMEKEDGNYYMHSDVDDVEIDNLDLQKYEYAIVLRMDTYASAQDAEAAAKAV